MGCDLAAVGQKLRDEQLAFSQNFENLPVTVTAQCSTNRELQALRYAMCDCGEGFEGRSCNKVVVEEFEETTLSPGYKLSPIRPVFMVLLMCVWGSLIG